MSLLYANKRTDVCSFLSSFSRAGHKQRSSYHWFIRTFSPTSSLKEVESREEPKLGYSWVTNKGYNIAMPTKLSLHKNPEELCPVSR